MAGPAEQSSRNAAFDSKPVFRPVPRAHARTSGERQLGGHSGISAGTPQGTGDVVRGAGSIGLVDDRLT